MSSKRPTTEGQYPTLAAATQTAIRKARYGHRDWIVWTDRQGTHHAERVTAEAVKAAMLAIGTQGHFRLYSGGSPHPMMVDWRIANIMRRNYLAGYYA